MISPTLRAVFLMLAGLPVLVVIAVIAPGLWTLSAGWIAGVLALMLADTALVARAADLDIQVDAPPLLYISGTDPVDVTFRFRRGPLPGLVETELETNELIEPPVRKWLKGFADKTHIAAYTLTPIRRGTGRLEKIWARWKGPLGLVSIRKTQALGTEIAITPNTRWVKDEAVRLYQRDADFGIKMQIDRGDGSEFDALREFTAGMDRRAIDWKHSARHNMLLAKEFRTERNHNIVFAFDTGRLMSEPLRGVPKIDRAINSALLLAYVSLRSGDRTAIFGFDARPGVSSNLLTGTGAFPHVQKLASELDYSAEDANYTLALTSLAARLERRSLVILFTDFVDTISAELMLENVRRLTDKHIVVFATFEDEALSAMIDAEPGDAEDVSRAVVADTLLQEREIVFRKLQRMGVQIVETTPEKFGSELVSRYLDIKRRELI
ncbi:DUF58 domain-containing protein [Henriciella marina]|uniref:DUF58 domain-containing protein n=1 Tax=Henriciella marina TaxID=453851 RepID=UPI00037026E7|nr:DUF58 domain-containing protein [Henriciella marina]